MRVLTDDPQWMVGSSITIMDLTAAQTDEQTSIRGGCMIDRGHAVFCASMCGVNVVACDAKGSSKLINAALG
ncbi:MAG TPA: hypothetical protein VKE92_11570 [Anaerolineales bacterium]|nr:hypothetical protein [Anaerolineales bacterium]